MHGLCTTAFTMACQMLCKLGQFPTHGKVMFEYYVDEFLTSKESDEIPQNIVFVVQ